MEVHYLRVHLIFGVLTCSPSLAFAQKSGSQSPVSAPAGSASSSYDQAVGSIDQIIQFAF